LIHADPSHKARHVSIEQPILFHVLCSRDFVCDLILDWFGTAWNYATQWLFSHSLTCRLRMRRSCKLKLDIQLYTKCK
jgi:hypothetical protein